MPTPAKKKIKHEQAHAAVNTPPSRDPELMRRMYSLLAQCRGISHQKQRAEATIVGSLMGLLPEDSLLFSGATQYTEILFAKDRAPEVLDLAPLDSKSPALNAASQISLGCGYALDRTLHHKAGLVLAFAGEADSLTPVRETLVFAATHKLPLVIVVQHELSRTKKSGRVNDLTCEILGTGVAGMTVDGSDAMAVYRVTQEAMYRARHEGGPTVLECKTCRKATVPGRLRPWVQGDALAYMEQQLRVRGFWKEKAPLSS